MTSARFQFVWWGWRRWWPLVAFKRLRLEETGLAMIYRWSACLGPLEVRRWVPERDKARLLDRYKELNP